jgi:hypothetical protein
MKVTVLDAYLDGGTLTVQDEHGRIYHVDRRINTPTYDKVFDGYPSNGKRLDIVIELPPEYIQEQKIYTT